MTQMQDSQEVAKLIKSLEVAQKNRRGKGTYSCKKTSYEVAGTDGIVVDSWKFNDWDYGKYELPTYARGLFTAKRRTGQPEIVARGYDKFFNVGELPVTEWENIEKSTVGPYELSVKENGCIIFMSGLENGTLLVCSKHSTGAREDAEKSHSINGERWAERHLSSAGKTQRDLALKLRDMNATAVAELCDDSFEEHVLAYPPEMAGLYLHGINFNLPDFATLSGPEVHHFADDWGFKKAQYTMFQDLDQVREFLQRCAQTGSWEGRETEGFVVRCHNKSAAGRPAENWFFKYKFEEPYLMYRQWRECTKAVIAGRPPKIRKHRQITQEYLLYARRQIAKNPKIAKEYSRNHGIIAMRDGFLREKGVRGSDIIAGENGDEGEDDENTTRDVVLVPIATIGCGKTTVAAALAKLFGFGHVQNDNIQGTKDRARRFVMQITNSMSEHPAVIADRNNHQKRERAQIMDDVLKVVPETKFVALHYVHEPKSRLLADIRKVTTRRVLDRGDNHQTIHAGTKGEYEILGIMDGFLHRFQGIDTNREPDSNFDEIIDLDVFASSRENLETVITRLYHTYPTLFTGEMPTHQDMDDAIAWAIGAVVDAENQHDLSKKFGQNEKKEKSNGSVPQNESLSIRDHDPAELIKRVEYFSLPVSSTMITSTLTALFKQASAEESQMFRDLKQNNRIQDEFHVTMIHRASAATKPEVWSSYTSKLTEKLDESGKQQKSSMPGLGPGKLRLERLVWDDRVMAFVVRILPGPDGKVWECANDIAHITVGTANASIKPKESNDLLAKWTQGDGSVHEKEVPGMKTLEGAVRAILQRGR